MMTLRHTLILLMSFLVLLALAGCSAPVRKRVLWPVYPATPRIEWLGTYASQDNFPKTGMQLFREGLLGKPDQVFFKFPFGIVSDSNGIVYVADNSDSKVQVYDLKARTITPYSEEPIFTRPAGLAIDDADNLYVVDAGQRAVLVFNHSRQLLRVIGSPQDLHSPAYVAIDQERERIYVSDPRANKIVIYNRSGEKTQEIGPKVVSENGKFLFSSPQGMAIDKKGNLYVAELLGARISIFDAHGNYLRSFGERGDAVNQFVAPKDLAFDSDGNLWIIDSRSAQIYTYTADGELLLATGTAQASSDPLGFSMPIAIFIAPDDSIYVTDRVNRRFSLWRYLSSHYLKDHPFSAEDQAYIQDVGRRVVVPPPLPVVPADGAVAPAQP